MHKVILSFYCFLINLYVKHTRMEDEATDSDSNFSEAANNAKEETQNWKSAPDEIQFCLEN